MHGLGLVSAPDYFKVKVAWIPFIEENIVFSHFSRHQVQFFNLFKTLKVFCFGLGFFFAHSRRFSKKTSKFPSQLDLCPNTTLVTLNPGLGNAVKHLHLWETLLRGTEPNTNHNWNTTQNPPFRKSLPPMMSRHPFIARQWLAWRERKRKESKKANEVWMCWLTETSLVGVSFIQYLYA